MWYLQQQDTEMKDSWILISHGDFNKTKKLFSYDRFGTHTLPVFKDAITANEFLQHVLDLYKQKKGYQLNYCENSKKLSDVLTLVCMAAKDLKNVIIDPLFAEGNTPETIRITENVVDLYEFITQLNALKSSEHS